MKQSEFVAIPCNLLIYFKMTIVIIIFQVEGDNDVAMI